MIAKTVQYKSNKSSFSIVVDRAMRLYRTHFWSYFGLFALIIFPLQAILWGVQYLVTGKVDLIVMGTSQRFSGLFVDASPDWFSYALLPIMIVIANIYIHIGLTHQTLACILNGEPVSIMGGIKAIGRNFGKITMHVFMLFIVLLGLCLWGIIPIVGNITFGGLLFFFIAMVVPISYSVLLLEPSYKRSKIVKRAWILVRDDIWTTFRLFLVLLFMLFFIQLALGTIAGFGTAITEFGDLSFSFNSWVEAIIKVFSAGLWLAIQFFIAPITTIVMALYYIQLRINVEGLDILLGLEQGRRQEQPTGEDGEKTAELTQWDRIYQLPARDISQERWVRFVDLGASILVVLLLIAIFFVPMMFFWFYFLLLFAAL